jgi:hypothetical protein
MFDVGFLWSCLAWILYIITTLPTVFQNFKNKTGLPFCMVDFKLKFKFTALSIGTGLSFILILLWVLGDCFNLLVRK